MRGFKDNIPPISYAIEYVQKVFQEHSKLFGCDFVDMPVVEESDLYFRTSGDASDVCNKELFEVRKWQGEFESWVLRPEGTASCMRAVKEHSLLQHYRFLRLAYFAPMFRYNRPQKGRYRQFLHAGWEFIGQEVGDLEVIIGAVEFIKKFNIDITLEINSIGTANDRTQYRKQLREFFNLDDQTDPLKILDKSEDFSNIPHMEINKGDADNFNRLKELLQENEIQFVHNPYLVRGLDYYNALVFELKAKSTNQTILAGGRYDGLMEQIGGSKVCAIGFAAGVDRIIEHMEYNHVNEKIAIIGLDNEQYTLQVAKKLRTSGHSCVVFWNLDLKKALSEANKQKYKYVVICGEKEAKEQTFIVKNLEDRTEFSASLYAPFDLC